MNRLPFETLKDSMTFQRICADVVLAEGGKNIRGFGTGPDQGNDFMFDLPVSSLLKNELQPHIAQCKWYKVGNNVGENEIGDMVGYLDTHQADGLLIITSSQFTGTAVTKIEAINRRRDNKVYYWDGVELSKRLRKHPGIINKYWYQNGDETEDGAGQLPAYDESEWLEKYGLSSYRIAAYHMDSFPTIPSNNDAVKAMIEFAAEFTEAPPRITIIDGAMGAGKTGYAIALLNQKKKEGYKVATVTNYEYNQHYFEYALSNKNDFLNFLHFCQEVDFLLLDDFGMWLTDKSETLIKAAKALIDIVNVRSKQGKPTILTLSRAMTGKTVQNYLEFLKGNYPFINVGEESLRSRGLEIMNENLQSRALPSKSSDSRRGGVLGKAWLIEKYDLLEKEIDEAMRTLLRPEEEDHSLREFLHERFGDSESREDELREILKGAKRRISQYRNFVDGFDFQAIVFFEDGKVQVFLKGSLEE